MKGGKTGLQCGTSLLSLYGDAMLTESRLLPSFCPTSFCTGSTNPSWLVEQGTEKGRTERGMSRAVFACRPPGESRGLQRTSSWEIP